MVVLESRQAVTRFLEKQVHRSMLGLRVWQEVWRRNEATEGSACVQRPEGRSWLLCHLSISSCPHLSSCACPRLQVEMGAGATATLGPLGEALPGNLQVRCA